MCTRRRSYAPGVSEKSRISSGVSTGPGHRALTRTPCRANCTASSRLIESTAPFDAVYPTCEVAPPIKATNEATLMTEPPPALSRCGMPYLQQRKTPLAFTACTRSQASGSVVRIESSSAGMMPALLYRTSTFPNRFAAASYIASTLLGSLPSAWKKKASLHSEAVFSPASFPTSATHTRAPSDEQSSAASRPMPPAAPVITATLPSSLINLLPSHRFPLNALEEPRAFVIGDDFVEERLLRARVVQIVVDDIVPESLPGHLAALQLRDSIAHRVRESLDVGFVCIALELR